MSTKGLSNLKKDDNIIDFNAIRSGLAPGGPGGEENWLKTLPKGTMFVCKRRNAPKDHLALELYFVMEHKDLTSNILQKIPTGQQADLWVDSLEFSRAYLYKETVATVELEYQYDKEEQSELTDGNSEGSLQQGGLENDAPAEAGPK